LSEFRGSHGRIHVSLQFVDSGRWSTLIHALIQVLDLRLEFALASCHVHQEKEHDKPHSKQQHGASGRWIELPSLCHSYTRELPFLDAGTVSCHARRHGHKAQPAIPLH
jgi:hypothetical protein